MYSKALMFVKRVDGSCFPRPRPGIVPGIVLRSEIGLSTCAKRNACYASFSPKDAT